MKITASYLAKLVLVAWVLLLLIPSPASACEPIIPLFLLVGGPQLLLGSILALVLGVTLKSSLFAYLETSLSKGRSFLFMCSANVVTTVIGVFVAAAIATPAGIVALPLICVFSYAPAKRLQRSSVHPLLSRMGPVVLSVLLCAFLVLTYILFAKSQDVMLENATLYWLTKLGFVYPALAISIGLTTIWEEWLVFCLSGRPAGVSFFPAALRANLVTMLFLFAVAAAMVLPERLASRDFLVLLQVLVFG